MGKGPKSSAKKGGSNKGRRAHPTGRSALPDPLAELGDADSLDPERAARAERLSGIVYNMDDDNGYHPTLWVELLRAGDDSVRCGPGDVVEVHYACLLAASGAWMDSSRSGSGASAERGWMPFRFTLGAGGVVAGMDAGVRHLSLGALNR